MGEPRPPGDDRPPFRERPDPEPGGRPPASGSEGAAAQPESADRGGITRRDLQLVIRRAAELYTGEADEDERLSEAEVLRVADELGLPGRYVRQALYELPAHGTAAGQGGWVDTWFGGPYVQGTRVVPGGAGPVLDRLEEYLVTREFLQIRRRMGGRATFAPADDAISNVARAVRRPQRQWQIARSRGVLVDVRPIGEGESHVRMELDLGPQRRSALSGGLVGGALIGAPLAALVGLPVGVVVVDVAGQAAGTAAGVVAGLGALGASASAGLAIARARFRRRVGSARLEIASLLDRLEGGRRLDPPPAPWLRSLRARISDSLRG